MCLIKLCSKILYSSLILCILLNSTVCVCTVQMFTLLSWISCIYCNLLYLLYFTILLWILCASNLWFSFLDNFLCQERFVTLHIFSRIGFQVVQVWYNNDFREQCFGCIPHTSKPIDYFVLYCSGLMSVSVSFIIEHS